MTSMQKQAFCIEKITNILIKFVCLTLQKYPTIMKIYRLNLKVAIFNFKIELLLRKMNLFLLYFPSQKLVLWTAIHCTGQPLKRSFWNKKKEIFKCANIHKKYIHIYRILFVRNRLKLLKRINSIKKIK